MDIYLSANQLSDKAGVPREFIRYLRTLGFIIPVAKVGKRQMCLYAPEEVETVLRMKEMREAGKNLVEYRESMYGN